MTHPAKEFGKWLKAKRKHAKIVSRVFAGQISLSPAQYCEVEAGIVHWLKRPHEKLICDVLALDIRDTGMFERLLENARQASPLEFSDVFTREQLEPMRASSPFGKQLTEAKKNAILDAVFTPLQ